MLAFIFSLSLMRSAQAQSLQLVTPKKTLSLTLAELKTKLKSYTVKIDDPVYKKEKEFDAFLLKDVFELAGMKADDKSDEVVFTAVDGYAPNATFAQLAAHKAYLAYQDHSTPGRFALVAQGKSTISPWPFYVIWEEGAKLKESVPWPYQLVKIEVVDWAVKYPQVVPLKSASGTAEMKGFALFKAECIRCHSINGQGGELGPELNIPQNVTEYWKSDTLKKFIKKVSDFRTKDKMPDFSNLSSEQLDQLLAYLTVMKKYKN